MREEEMLDMIVKGSVKVEDVAQVAVDRMMQSLESRVFGAYYDENPEVDVAIMSKRKVDEKTSLRIADFLFFYSKVFVRHQPEVFTLDGHLILKFTDVFDFARFVKRYDLILEG